MASAEQDKERAHQRRGVLAELKVFEAGVAEPLGVMEDLSLGGFRLATPKVIAVGVRKQLHVPLPEKFGKGDPLAGEAECRWLRANPKGPGFQCGFEFSEATASALAPLLNTILRQLP
ncbi:MAG: PilZ domain-containing protein [Planctomycetes bacterium]|nr:PilZ domain-containing protein [Planctomycetota bacterium]